MKKSGHIVIVDDNTGVLVAMNLLLRRHFERVTLLTSPDRLPETLRRENVSTVILDMNFTNMTNSGREGLYWLDEIMRSAPDVAVVLLTAYADIALAVEGLKHGARDFIVKPWDNDDLVAKIAATLSTDSAPQPARSKEPVTLAALERRAIAEAIETHGGNLSAVASALGITRQTLYNKMKRMGL